MIKVNLLQGGALANAGLMGMSADGVDILSAEETRKEALKRIFVILIFPAGLYFYEQQTLPGLQAQFNQTQAELNTLQAENAKNQETVDQIKKIQESQLVIEQRLDLVRRIDSEKGKEIRVLDLFQNVIPETVWFKDLEYRDGVFTVRGNALSDSDVSSFVESLSKSVHFSSVYLVSSAEEKIEDNVVKTFEVRCQTEKPVTVKEGPR